MSGSGYQDNLSRTSDFVINRDRVIRLAYEEVKAIPAGEPLSAEDLQAGKDRLNLIIREMDGSGKWQWAIESSVHVPLIGGVGVYDGNVQFPTNVSEILSVVYRSADGRDSPPLDILTVQEYEKIEDKLQNGMPRRVYLSEDRDVTQRRLYIHPFPSTVTTQSQVIGTDGVIYRCVYPHVSSATTRPTDGPNWRMMWEIGAGATTTWASGASYSSGESIRIRHRRPIFDMTESDHIPDFPPQFQRLLVLRLAQDLTYSLTTEEQAVLSGKVKGAYQDIFDSTRPKTNDIHNKVMYF